MTLPLPTDTSLALAKRIVLSVHARCKLITIGNGFLTDMGNVLLLGRPTLSLKELPAMLVFTAVEETEQARGKVTFQENALAVFIEGKVAWDGADVDQPELLAQDIVADIKRAVFKDADQTFRGEAGDNICKKILYGGRVIGYPKDGTKAVSARVRVNVEYREKYGAPEASV